MIPLQLHSFLLEVTSALRREILPADHDPDASHTTNATTYTSSKTAADYYHYDDDGDGGDSTLQDFVTLPLSVALLVLCLVGSASAAAAAAAACCTLRWSKRGTARPDYGRASSSWRHDL